jgi:glucokinase
MNNTVTDTGAPFYLALDFGGTKHAAALIEMGSPDPIVRRVAAGSQSDRVRDLQAMDGLIQELRAHANPTAIGVSFGGPVDYQTGIVRLSHHVPQWENFSLADYLAATYRLPAVVDNDANVAALGEHRFGAGRGMEAMLYVTVSTGVGGGLVLGGEIWRGFRSMAGEIGHTVVDPHGPRCLCGKHGCVERLASGPYMVHDAMVRLEQNPDSGKVLRQLLAGNERPLDGALLSEAAAMGDELARTLFRRSAAALGTGIGNAVNLLDLPLVVVGGGVSKSGDLWWETLRETVDSVLLPEIHAKVEQAELGDVAPLWGAAVLASLRFHPDQSQPAS